MRSFIPKRGNAPASAIAPKGDATLQGADLLLSMVEARWTSTNGNGDKMQSGEKAKTELDKIERQLTKLQSADHLDDDPRSNDGNGSKIQHLRGRIEALRLEVAASRSAWRKTELARHAQRPYTLDYIARIFSDWSEVHGDRGFGDDPAIICGMVRFHGVEAMVIGHQKARDTKQKVYRNFGMPNPEGYRKALRAMKMAEKFSRPVFTFVDTPGAYPGLGAEERGQAEAIARNLREMVRLRVPIITTITGEGGSGGALAIAVADRVLMMENSVYSVISPEGCASIMWRDASKKELAAQALKITAKDLSELRCIDGTVPEPEGGAHTDHDAAAALLDVELQRHLAELNALSVKDLLDARYTKFRNIAQFYVES